MSRTWRRRALLAVVVWAATVGLLAAIGMRPSPVPLAGITLCVAAVTWLLLDLGDVASPTSWYAASDAGGTGLGADARLRALHRQLLRDPSRDGGELHALLVGLIDDRLRTEHAIDRRTNPAAAASILGEPLNALAAGPAPSDLTDPTVLSAILTRIEAL